MSDKVRLNLWISEREKAALQRIADANDASLNLVGRVVIRRFLGLPTRVKFDTDQTDQTDQTETEVRA